MFVASFLIFFFFFRAVSKHVDYIALVNEQALWLRGKESACNAEDLGLIPGSGRTPGGGHGNPFQCSCLKNPIDRGTWQATVHRVAKNWTQLE